MAPQHSNSYLSTLIQTGDRTDVVIALYEGAIAFVAQAMDAIEEGDAEKRSQAVRRAADVLMALSGALDFTQDGDIAGRLFATYNFQLRHLLEANRANDPAPLQTVKSMLTIMLDGWREAAKTPEAKAIREADAEQRSTRPAAARSAGPRPALALTA